MDQKNLILAVVLSVTILLGFQLVQEIFFPPPEAPQQAVSSDGSLPPSADPLTPGVAGESAGAEALNRGEAIEANPRIEISSGRLSGSLSLKGGRIDDLTLTTYRETIEPDSPNITLLSPPDSPDPYYANFGWSSVDKSVQLPSSETTWQPASDVLKPGKSTVLNWDNGQGLTFEREVELSDGYLFTVTQRVTNNGEQSVTLSPYGLISRTNTPDVTGFYVLHEGPIGVFDGTLNEYDYDDLQDSGTIKHDTTGGWLGITDIYWLVALAPDNQQRVSTRFVHDGRNGIDKYQADMLYEAVTVAPGDSFEITSRVFAGAKEVLMLADYRDRYGIKDFEKAVDFGIFWFLTEPLFYALHWIFEIVGNFGVAILIVTVCVKAFFFPLANKSYVSMAKMKKLQPKMVELRERFGEDKQRLNQEMMALYKREGANPLSGCLPILVQIPVFFALYKVLLTNIEMRHAPFFGWIQDLSAPDPTSWINGFGLLPWSVPELDPILLTFSIGVWPILMGLTMFLQQKLNPPPPDPVQAKIFMFLPLVFTFLLGRFAAGLVIYWTWNNLLSILQQYFIMRRAGVPIGRQPSPKGE